MTDPKEKTSAQVPPPIESSLQDIEQNVAEIRAYFVTPIDCQMSPWVLDSATPWKPDPCPPSGLQTRDAIYTRTILTPPENGGAACGPVQETRVESQTCTPPPQHAAGLLLQNDLVYEGGFRVPTASGEQQLNYGGTGLEYWPARDSLIIVGHDHYQKVGEISIPTPTQAATIGALPRATWKQMPVDILQGKRLSVDGGTANGVKVGGVTPVGPDLVVHVWTYYDAIPTPQTLTHFLTGPDFANLPPVRGPFQVGRGFQDYYSKDISRIGGFVSGYTSPIPAQWRGPLGGTHLIGQGGMISVLGRTSAGPSATVYTPSELEAPASAYAIPGAAARDAQLEQIADQLERGLIDHITADAQRQLVWADMRGNRPTTTPRDTRANATLVMGYPTGAPLNHPTLGNWGQNGGLYNGTQGFRGMVFPEGTRSILFFGWGGTSFCYGAGTADESLHFQPHPSGGTYCYDPASLGKGTHGYPYRGLVFAYDVLDFVAVKEGRLLPWDVKPYATWTFGLPFQAKIDPASGLDVGTYIIGGAGYDPIAGRIFLSAQQTDGTLPIIHSFKLPALT